MHWIFAGYTEYVEGQWYDVTTYDELKWNNWATGNFPLKRIVKMNECRFIIGEPNNWGRNNEDCIAFGMISHINTTFNDVPCDMEVHYPLCSSPPPSRVKITYFAFFKTLMFSELCFERHLYIYQDG